MTNEDFFQDFRQQVLAGADAERGFELEQFLRQSTEPLIDSGIIEGFDPCYYRALKGMRVDGYWFEDDGEILNLFIADYEGRETLETLTGTDVKALFKRVTSFFKASHSKLLYRELEETSPGYGLARDIYDRKTFIRRLNIFLLSERVLSGRVQSVADGEILEIPVGFDIWDISRYMRMEMSSGQKEALNINISDKFGSGIPCIPAYTGAETYRSYLAVVPAVILSRLYDEYGARLLEQNVRSFLQARGKINKGIRSTIMHEPSMFFAYNNGITAIAQDVSIKEGKNGLEITDMKDLQIVNGGQTTASLFHTARRDKAPLDGVFVQMKLSVITGDARESVIPKISQYANTQNKVNDADFFSNHPFHLRIEELSRRKWAPAAQGELRETKWFYERARGQYADQQSKLTPAEQRKFQAEFPKKQMFAKTDLAKFENIWEDHPKYVNLGAQKNFARFAERIGKEWSQSNQEFNDVYYERLIARAIIFRSAEKIVSSQSWYNGGYRANIVAYTIALIGECCKIKKVSVNFGRIWKEQRLYKSLEAAIAQMGSMVSVVLMNPQQGISNISEWAKKDQCWHEIKESAEDMIGLFPPSFFKDAVDMESMEADLRFAKSSRKVDDSIEAQLKVAAISPATWQSVLEKCVADKLLRESELRLLAVAARMPDKMPTEKQCESLLKILSKVEVEGILVE